MEHTWTWASSAGLMVEPELVPKEHQKEASALAGRANKGELKRLCHPEDLRA